MSKNNVVLIGMPGAGKSTIGVLLAKSLNKRFVDTDLCIQEKCGKKLYEIINESGIDDFVRIENDIIASLDIADSVVATGGSAIFGAEAMSKLSSSGTIVYLKLDADEISSRIKNIKTRGIAMDKGETIFDVYQKRKPYYEKYADYTVDCAGLTVEECVSEIVEIFENTP